MLNMTNTCVFKKSFDLLTVIMIAAVMLSGILLFCPKISASGSDALDIDPQLRKAIMIKLNRNIDSTDPITISDMQSLMGSLRIEGGEIDSIEGLQYATSLNAIEIISTILTDITPISNLENLQILFFRAPIMNLPSLKGLSSLDDFAIYESQLTDITNIGELPSDVRIKIENSPLKTLPDSSALKNIKYLNLGNNRIDDISNLAGLKSLKELNLSHNNISDISMITGLPNLESLDLSFNSIYDFSSLSAIPKLLKLNLAGNNIKSLPDKNFSTLTNLDISFNELLSIDLISRFPLLKNFVAPSNQISSLPSLVSNTAIENLQLSNNAISNISKLASYNGSKLTFVGLTNNRVTDISELIGVDINYEIGLHGNNIDLSNPKNYNAVLSWDHSPLNDTMLRQKCFGFMKLETSGKITDITNELNWYKISVSQEELSLRFCANLKDGLTLLLLVKINGDLSEDVINSGDASITLDIPLDKSKTIETFTYKASTCRTGDEGIYKLSGYADFEYITLVVTKIPPTSQPMSQPKPISGDNAILITLLAAAVLLIAVIIVIIIIVKKRTKS